MLAVAAKSTLDAQSPMNGFVNSLGGPPALADLPSFDALNEALSERMNKWWTTARVVELIYRADQTAGLEGFASINKAVHVLEVLRPKDADVKKWPRHASDIRGMWSSCRPVAHFCSAVTTFQRAIQSEQVTGSLPDWLPEILAVARGFQRWGMSRVDPRSKQPLLMPGETWCVADDLELPEIPLSKQGLADEEIQAMKSYKAAQRL
jgi:hypothetical protein